MFKNINSGTLFWFANFFRSRLFRLSRIDELVAWLAYWTTAKEKERSLSKDLTKKPKKKTNKQSVLRKNLSVAYSQLLWRAIFLNLEPRSLDPFPVLEMRSNSRAKQLTELLFSSSWVFIPSRPKLLLIFTDRGDIYSLTRSGTLECRSIYDRLTYHCLCFPPSMTDECFER